MLTPQQNVYEAINMYVNISSEGYALTICAWSRRKLYTLLPMLGLFLWFTRDKDWRSVEMMPGPNMLMSQMVNIWKVKINSRSCQIKSEPTKVLSCVSQVKHGRYTYKLPLFASGQCFDKWLFIILSYYLFLNKQTKWNVSLFETDCTIHFGKSNWSTIPLIF